MAPITDDTVEALRDTIHKLESRVQQLEAKLGHGDGSSTGSSKKPLQSVRMILMGPPGAGLSSHQESLSGLKLTGVHRQGHTSTEDPGQILCLPLGRFCQSLIKSVHRRLRYVLGNRGYAAISSSEEDVAREGSQEDNGSGWSSQR